MKLSQITPNLSATIKVGEEALTFYFRQPTVRLWREMQVLEETEQDSGVKELAMLVTDTGLDDEEGNRLLPTEETFRDVIPATISSRMLAAIIESIGHFEKKLSSNSDDGSSTKESSAPQSRKSKSTN